MQYIATSRCLLTESVTRRILVSEIAKVFNVLGWFAQAVVSVKVIDSQVGTLWCPVELYSAQVLARILHHVREIFRVPLSAVYAWTDSTIVPGLVGRKPLKVQDVRGKLPVQDC